MMMMRQRALKGDVELINELPHDLPASHADERKAKQIMLNLLSNAVNCTKPGSADHAICAPVLATTPSR